MSGGYDDRDVGVGLLSGRAQRLDQVIAIHLGHFAVNYDQVDHIVFKDLQGLCGIVAYKFDLRSEPRQGLDGEGERKGLVSDHHHHGVRKIDDCAGA